MSFRYVFGTFMLCLFMWAVVVDHAILADMDKLKQDVGYYTRYRVKEWSKNGKLDLLEDELLIYAVVENREQLYYMDYKPHFKQLLRSLPEGTPLQLRYDYRFPKFWKRHLYDLRSSGQTIMGYSSAYLITKQREIWKFTGIMVGVFLFLLLLGLINRPKKR